MESVVFTCGSNSGKTVGPVCMCAFFASARAVHATFISLNHNIDSSGGVTTKPYYRGAPNTQELKQFNRNRNSRQNSFRLRRPAEGKAGLMAGELLGTGRISPDGYGIE